MNDARTAALAFLKDHHAGVLSTVTPDGKPHGSAVYYVVDDAFNIYILTLKSSGKFANLQAHPAVAFTVGRQDVPQTIQIEGVASVLQHPEEIGEHSADLMNVLTSNSRYYAPLTQLGDDESAIIWIQPKKVIWGDFTSSGTNGKGALTELAL